MGDPTTQLARLPRASPEEIQQLRAVLRARQAAARAVRRLRRATPRGWTSGSARRRAARCGRRSRTRCRGRCCWSASARCWPPPRHLAGDRRRHAKRDTHRRRAARLQPVHLLGARVLDRGDPDPGVRGRDPDLPGRPAGDAGQASSTRGFAHAARRRPAPRPARHRDDADAARPVLRDHAQLDGRRPHRGLHHRQARHRAAVDARRARPRGAERAAAAGDAVGASSSASDGRRRDHDRDDLLLARPRRARATRRSTTRTSRCCRGRSSSSRSR